jgi:beta-lactamase class A
MKTPVMVEVFKQARAGKFALDDALVVRNEFKSIVDGSSYQLDLKDDSDDSMYKILGSSVPIRELLHHMITVSSNLATNVLIDLVGPKNVTATMRELGASEIQVLRGVEDSKAFDRGMNNRTSARDLLFILRAIARGKAVDSLASREMVDILLDQKFNEMIPALLPEGVRVAHKTGNITGVEHDSAIVFLPDGRVYVLVILSKDLKAAAEGRKAIALASKRIYDYMVQGK